MKWTDRRAGVVRAGLVMLVGWLAAGDAVAIEKLAYEVIQSDGPFELRRIDAHVVAETFVAGEFESVGNEGFRRLAAYIGGANRSKAKIAMRAPVAQGPASETIAMTAPVAQEKAGDRYRITFVMPARYAFDDLPQPTDERVVLRREPERTVAVIRYSGFWSRARYLEHEERLRCLDSGRGPVRACGP